MLGARWKRWLLLSAALGCSTDTSGLALAPARDNSLETETPTVAPPGGGSRGAAELDNGDGVDEVDPVRSSGGSIQLLNGLLNVEELYACVSRSPAETTAGSPLVLSFAESVVLDSNRQQDEPGLTAQLYASSADGLAGLDCGQLAALSKSSGSVPGLLADSGQRGDAGLPRSDAGAERGQQEVADLGRLALGSGAFLPGRHFVVVPTGCADVESREDLSLCGPPDRLGGHRSQILSVPIGEAPARGVGLQFLHASRATGVVEVLLRNEASPTAPIRLAAASSLGSVRPRLPAEFDVDGLLLGVSTIELRLESSLEPDFAQAWSRAVLALTLPLSGSYLLVYLGNDPRADRLGPFHSPKFALLQGRSNSVP